MHASLVGRTAPFRLLLLVESFPSSFLLSSRLWHLCDFLFFGWICLLFVVSGGSGGGVIAYIGRGRGRRGGRRGGGERGRAEKDGGVSGVIECVCAGHWKEARFPRILASFPFFWF